MLTSLVLLALSYDSPWLVNPPPPELKYPGGLTDHQVARMSLKEWTDTATAFLSNIELADMAGKYVEAQVHVTDSQLFFVEPIRKERLTRLRRDLYFSLRLVLDSLYATTYGGTCMWHPQVEGELVVEKTILNLLDGRTDARSNQTESLEYVNAIAYCVEHSTSSADPDLREFYLTWRARTPKLLKSLNLLAADAMGLDPNEKAMTFAAFVDICRLFEVETFDLAPGYEVPSVLKQSEIVDSD